MTAINYTSLDFLEIKNNLKEFLRSNSDWTDFDFDGSNISILLDLLSYNSQYAAFLANMVANESYLDSASIRDNVVLLARQLGYLPKSVTGAYAFFDLNYQLLLSQYPSGYPKTITIKKGSVYSVSDIESAYTLSTPDDITTSVSSSGLALFRGLRLTEGILIEDEFIIDNSNPTQVFILNNENIDTSTIRVRVEENVPSTESTTYVLSDTLTNIDNTSRIYWLDEVDNKRYKILLGDGIFGFKPSTGSILKVSYIITNGPLANGIQGSSKFAFIGDVVDSLGNTVITDPLINNQPRLEGGSDIESISAIKQNSTRNYTTQNRAVTSLDYESIVRKIYPAADDVYAFGGETATPPQYGRVFVVVKPRFGRTISNRLKSEIRRELVKFKVASTDIDFIDPGILNIEVLSNVFYDSTQTKLQPDAIRSKVLQSLNNYSQSDSIRKFKGEFRYSRVVALIDDSDKSIQYNTTSIRIRRDLPVLLNTPASYLITFGNAFKTDTVNPVISSNGFRISGSSLLFFLEDDTKGKIYSYYFDSNNNKIISNRNLGEVDYNTGIVKLGYNQSLNITSTSNGNNLLIRAIPQSNDVFSVNEIYLNLDVNGSVIAVSPR